MRRFLRLLAVAGLLSLAVAGFAACGGDDDESQDSGGDAGQASSTSDSRGGPGGDGGGKGSEAGPALTGDVEEARRGVESVDEIYEGFGAAVEAGVAATDVGAINTLEAAEGSESLSSVCDLMSEDAKRQTVVYVKRSAGLADVKWTCEKATGLLLLRRASQTGGLKKSLRAKIVGVNVEGDRATASIRFGGKGPISTMPLVKEDGDWKLAASPSGGSGK